MRVIFVGNPLGSTITSSRPHHAAGYLTGIATIV
jgi:hypothetical protein